MNKRSSSQQHSTTPRLVNHSCRDVGHDWQLTTDEAIRQCTRHDCRAVERLVYGSWMPISSSPAQQDMQPAPASSAFYQLAFWAEDQQTQRPLDLESLTLLTREQRAHFARLEREYYNLSSGPRVRRVW